MIHSVSKEMITAIQCVPRIAERVTPAAAAHQKVHLCLQRYFEQMSCLIAWQETTNCRKHS